MDAEREQKKSDIVNAAFKLFLLNGYSNTKMSDVAKSAGFAKATLYDYFENKETLFKEVVEKHIFSPYFSFKKKLDKSQPAKYQLEQFLDLEMALIFKWQDELCILPNISLQEAQLPSNTLAEMIHKIVSYKFHVIYDLVENGIASGEFEPNNPAVIATCIIGASNSFIASYCKASMLELPAYFPDLPVAKQSFFDSIFNGICK